MSVESFEICVKRFTSGGGWDKNYSVDIFVKDTSL
jgi:hypothetical protein